VIVWLIVAKGEGDGVDTNDLVGECRVCERFDIDSDLDAVNVTRNEVVLLRVGRDRVADTVSDGVKLFITDRLGVAFLDCDFDTDCVGGPVLIGVLDAVSVGEGCGAVAVLVVVPVPLIEDAAFVTEYDGVWLRVGVRACAPTVKVQHTYTTATNTHADDQRMLYDDDDVHLVS